MATKVGFRLHSPITFTLGLSLLLCCIQFLLRSSDLASDGLYRIQLILNGGKADAQMGGWNHFLQMPLMLGLWNVLGKPGGETGIHAILLGFGLLGNFLSFFFLGRTIRYLWGSRRTEIATLTFLACTPIFWFYWNGELSGFALGFAFLSLYWAVAGQRRHWIALALALSALCRVDFALIAPGIVWLRHPVARPTRKEILGYVRELSFFTALVTLMAGGILLVGLRLLGLIEFSSASLLEYNRQSLGVAGDYILPPSLLGGLKALKGLLSTITPAIHSGAELLRGAAHTRVESFLVLYWLYFGAVLTALAWAVAILFKKFRLQRWKAVVEWGALLCIVPVQLLFNLRFGYQSEEYHSASLVGIALLVASVLDRAAEKLRWVYVGCGAWILGFMVLYVAPAVQFPVEQSRAAEWLRFQNAKIIECDQEIGRLNKGQRVSQLSLIRDLALSEVTEEGALPWVERRIEAALGSYDHVYFAGPSCELRYLLRRADSNNEITRGLAQVRVDTLNRAFKVKQVDLPPFPANWYNQYDPTSWRYVQFFELSKEGPVR